MTRLRFVWKGRKLGVPYRELWWKSTYTIPVGLTFHRGHRKCGWW